MNSSLIKCKNLTENWREKVSIFISETRNKSIKKILSDIYEIDGQKEEYFEIISNNFMKVIEVTFDHESIKVLNIINELMNLTISISYEIICCIKLSKIILKILKGNIKLAIYALVIENFVDNLCKTIWNVYNSSKPDDLKKKFIKMQLSILIQVEKLSSENFQGHKYVSKLFIYLIDADIDEYSTQFKEILSTQMQAIEFYRNIFNAFDDQEYVNDLFRFSSLIVHELKNNECIDIAMHDKEDSNLCWQIIQFYSRHFQSIENELDELITQSILSLLQHSNISTSNYKFIEGIMIREVIEGTNLNTSKICSDILCQHIINIECEHTIQLRFKFYQACLMKLWNPKLIEFSDQRQVHIARILKIIHTVHFKSVQQLINPDLEDLMMNKSDVIRKNRMDFLKCCSEFHNEANASIYYELVKSVDTLSMPSSEAIKNLYHLIEVTRNCNIHLFSPLIIAFLNFINAYDDYNKKMLFLLRLKPLMIRITEEASTHLRLRLVNFLTFCISTTEIHDNIKHFLKDLLNKLLSKDQLVSRQYFNFLKNNNLDTNALEKKYATKSNYFQTTHVCVKREPSDKTDQIKHLQNIFLYSKSLFSKSLTRDECKIISEIVNNFTEISKNYKENMLS